jgi:hypothetical protein
MPSPRRKAGRRTEINVWRVKVGKKAGEVFSGSEGDCRQWVREHQKDYRVKLRVIPPNA